MKCSRKRETLKGRKIKGHIACNIPILNLSTITLELGASCSESEKTGSRKISFAASSDFEASTSTREQQRAGRVLAGAETRVETSATSDGDTADSGAGVGVNVDSKTRNIAKPRTAIELHMNPTECYFILNGKKYALAGVPYIGSFTFHGKECISYINSDGRYVFTYDSIEISTTYSIGDTNVYIFTP